MIEASFEVNRGRTLNFDREPIQLSMCFMLPEKDLHRCTHLGSLQCDFYTSDFGNQCRSQAPGWITVQGCWQIIKPRDVREFCFILSMKCVVEEDPIPDGNAGQKWFSHLHLAALLGSGAFSA